MKKIIKRIMALMLSLVMILGCNPIEVKAGVSVTAASIKQYLEKEQFNSIKINIIEIDHLKE